MQVAVKVLVMEKILQVLCVRTLYHDWRNIAREKAGIFHIHGELVAVPFSLPKSWLADLLFLPIVL